MEHKNLKCSSGFFKDVLSMNKIEKGTITLRQTPTPMVHDLKTL